MKQRSFLLTLLSSAILAGSCDPVAIDGELPDGSARLCINSYFMADSTVWVYVTRGGHILSDDDGYLEPVNDATVTISGDSKPPTTMSPLIMPRGNYRAEGWYESPTGFRAGENSRITVSADGLGSVSATCFIPEPVPLLKAEIVSSQPDENGRIPIDLYFDDPPETENYYRVTMRYLWAPDAETSPKDYTQYEELSVVTDDPLFSYDPEPFSLNGEDVPLPVLFTDNGMNGKSIKVRCMIHDPGVALRRNYNLQVELQSISKAYYLHKTTEALQEAVKDDPFVQPAQIYSNVENGFGIFAGGSCSAVIINL